MKKVTSALLLCLLLLFNSNNILGQSIQNNIWKDISSSSLEVIKPREYFPEVFRSLRVDFELLKGQLLKASSNNLVDKKSEPIYFIIPNPDGSNETYKLFESPIMHPDLAAQFPFIKTFSAQSIDHPSRTARLDFTEWGFHAMVISTDGWFFIEPFSQGNVNDYIGYYKKDSKQKSPFNCEFNDHSVESLIEPPGSGPLLRTSGSQLKSYRLALACTGEYATFHGGTVSGAMSAMVTTMNRVNGVYELEVAVRMILIANTNLLVYTNSATDPYTNSSGSTMLSENQSNINAVIGTANYDIGHVFSTGGGGVAYLGSVCGSSKAGGVTGQSSPVGDNFDIDYVAHEMGHQFGGNHTFNSVTGNCTSNRTGSTAYEPGSGTTIMAYAGICGADDIQPHSDPLFHSKSYDQIQIFITTGSGNNCDVQTGTGNTPPTVNAGSNYTIPYLTAFKLTGSATDADNDPLTYLWEEYDTGPAGAPNSPSGNAPIFRVFTPSIDSSRTFPRIQDLVRNQQTLGEILPSYARSLTFKFTARDNRLNGGGVGNNDASVVLTVINTGTAFSVSSPNTNLTWQGFSNQTVTWNVSSTDLSPISCANVNILLSTDSGYTFPYTLVSNTPNDGSQVVTIPNVVGNSNRIKVESVGNVFFDMSDVNFSISAGSGVLANIYTDPLVSNNLCAGSVLDVGFLTDGVPNVGNNYYAQLSNSSGSFASGVVVIGSILNSTLSSGTIVATIPGGTASGSNYRIRVVSTSPAVNGTDNGANISISSMPGIPGTIIGTSVVCQGQSGIVYSVPVIANATAYVWNLPGGASITSGANTNSITVSYSGLAVSGNISVRGTNAACGNGPVSSNFSVSVNPLPGAAGMISGLASVCQNSSGHIYSVGAIANASSYVWSLPVGASITSGSGTNTVTISFSAVASSGDIAVYGLNSCGSGSPSTLAINVNLSPANPTINAAGSVDLCPGGDVSLSFTVAPGIDYQWRKNSVDLIGENSGSYLATSAGTYDVIASFSPMSPQSFSNSNPVAIPDNDCVGGTSIISVSGYSSQISSAGISVQLNITHTYDGDLVLMLEAPDGSVLGLSNRVGSSGDNFTNTVFSDAGSAQIPTSGAPYTGIYKPWTSLFNVCVQTTISTFSAIGGGAINPNGNWTLKVFDRAGIDLGTINNWTINFPGSFSGNCESVSNSIIVNEIPPVSISSFNPTTGSGGTTVVISGGDFSGTTDVLFNGLSASYLVDNASQITATVPLSATSGLIQVVGPCGNVYSAIPFVVGNPDLSVHLKVLIEGFYKGAGQMIGVLSPSICDSIEVCLADPSHPYSILYSVKGTIDLSGTGDFTFVGAGVNEYYYIVVKHRNALEIWTADSISFLIPSVNYDFTNASGTAYGSNEISVGGGKFAMYSGDVNQDGIIDSGDLSMMQTGLQSFLFGYYPHDLTGDAHVESADYSVVENNASGFITILKP